MLCSKQVRDSVKSTSHAVPAYWPNIKRDGNSCATSEYVYAFSRVHVVARPDGGSTTTTLMFFFEDREKRRLTAPPLSGELIRHTSRTFPENFDSWSLGH